MGEQPEKTDSPLRVNRGGKLDENEVIGRAREIANVLRALDSQSVQISAERRIGKTVICREVVRLLMKRGITALYNDIEHVNSASEFAGALLALVLPELGTRQKSIAWMSSAYKKFSGGSITLPEQLGGASGFGVNLPTLLEPHWKVLIEEAINALIAEKTTGKNAQPFVCLCLDEFPIALEKIRAAEGDRVAMDVLDLFRHLHANNGGKLRFIFTGSIGIHHIIRHLQKQKYANRPMNDVLTVNVHALSHSDARILALRLLEGEDILPEEPEAVIDCILKNSAAVPFYIHHLVGSLKDESLPATVANIESTLRNSIENPLDPWDLKTYVERLERYFPDTELVALALLDMIAVSPKPLDYDAILRQISVTRGIAKTPEKIVSETLDLLAQDFYIGREGEAQTYHFLRPLLARFWLYNRHLKAGAAHA